jgi:ribokinase
MTRAAVVGHVEWIEFARVARVPRPGEIVHVSETWEEPGGGGAVAAVQLSKLAGGCDFFTALAEDEMGRLTRERLEREGVTVHAARRPPPQRRAFVHVDDDGERTITVIGARMVARGDDDLPWEELDRVDAVYFTGGDPAALRHARRARTLVATPRAAGVPRAR